MIEAVEVSKQFDKLKALCSVSITVREGTVLGLLGTNGAGKSTFLRIMSGVFKPDKGVLTLDGGRIYENTRIKENLFYISDQQFFLANAIPKDMKNFYRNIYPNFDGMRFDRLLDQFGLESSRRINTLSKGMAKQLSILCAVCANTKYIFCDETFDGLDPVMRQSVKSLFAKEMTDRNLTAVITSHNLRELEDICDSVGLMHQGKMLLAKEVNDIKQSIHRVQYILRDTLEASKILEGMEIRKLEQRGTLTTIWLKGDAEEIDRRLEAVNPVFYERVPLSLEEIFISETEGIGYDIKKIIL